MASKQERTRENQTAVRDHKTSRRKGTSFSDGSIQPVKEIRFWRIQKTRRSGYYEDQRETNDWYLVHCRHSLQFRSRVTVSSRVMTSMDSISKYPWRIRFKECDIFDAEPKPSKRHAYPHIILSVLPLWKGPCRKEVCKDGL